LNCPNPDSPANTEAAKLLVDHNDEYLRRVRECTLKSLMVDTDTYARPRDFLKEEEEE
jgi:hypothetical protein